jgi:glutamate/tyrosine decarboxylase-like PLP-dependent enzyme
MSEFADFCRRAIDFSLAHGTGPASFGVAPESFDAIWKEFIGRLAELPSLAANGFAAHMVAPPHPAALLGYFATMLFNPNNHDVRHGAATLAMEREVVEQFVAMLGLPAGVSGHLTSGGSVANLDGLWSARRGRRDGVAASQDAHHVHRRNCRLMGVDMVEIPCDGRGGMDLEGLEDVLRRGVIDTVIASVGTPGFGAVDALDELVQLRRRYGFGLHVDASYGGFFALLRDAPDLDLPYRALAAFRDCDSIALDPHKHGYQPYGCGCVLYVTGEGGDRQGSPYCDVAPRSGIEGSRPGAAAAALWLTLRCLPLSPLMGFGPILRNCRLAAQGFAEQLAASGRWSVPLAPQLGVVAFQPRDNVDCARLRDAASVAGLELSLLRVPARRVGVASAAELQILRAVFMQAGHLALTAEFVDTLNRLI